MFWKTENAEPHKAPEAEERQTYDYKVTVAMKDGTVRSFVADYSFDTYGDGRLLVWQDALIEGKHYEYYLIPISEIREVMEQEVE